MAGSVAAGPGGTLPCDWGRAWSKTRAWLGREGLTWGGTGRVLAAPHRSPGPQVLFNVATAQCALGLWAEATRSLEAAAATGPDGARGDLRVALAQVQVRASRPSAGS